MATILTISDIHGRKDQLHRARIGIFILFVEQYVKLLKDDLLFDERMAVAVYRSEHAGRGGPNLSLAARTIVPRICSWVRFDKKTIENTFDIIPLNNKIAKVLSKIDPNHVLLQTLCR